MLADAASPRKGLPGKTVARIAGILALCATSLLSTGCTVAQRGEPPVVPPPLTKQIPLKIGVHYTLEFKLARPVVERRLWLIGDASVALFRTELQTLFEQVIELDRWPPVGKGPDVAGVLVPRVLWVRTDYGRVSICYEIEAFSRNGDPIGSWKVEGYSSGKGSFASDTQEISSAMRSAAAALIASFFREPSARAWLSENGISSESLK